MANGNRASYATIGFTLAMGIAAITGALVYLGGKGGDKNVQIAETYCNTPVSGLSVGSEVNFRGVKVGEVKEITFVGHEYENVSLEDVPKIMIVMTLNGKMLRAASNLDHREELQRAVDRGLRATVMPSGITGLSHVELNFARFRPGETHETPRLSWTPRNVYIPHQQSMFDSFSDSLERVMRQIDDMDFGGAWSNATAMVESASTLAGNANAIVESQRAAVDGIVSGAERAVSDLRAIAEELKENPSLLLRSRDPEPLPETK